MSAEALRNELLGRQLEVKKISEKKTFSKIEITKQKVKRAGDHALLPPDRRVRARRHPDRRRDRDGAGGHRQRAVPGDAPGHRRADPDRHPVLRGARPPPRRLPDLLHRHPALGRDHRSARRRARPALAVPRARPRVAPEGEVGADLPGDHPRHVDRHRRHPRRVRAAAVHRRSSRSSTPSCRCRRSCCSTSRTSPSSGGARSSAAAPSIIVGLVPVPAGPIAGS